MLWIIWIKCFSSTPSKFTKYFNYKSRFNCIFSRYNLPRRNDGVYIINLNDKESKVTHWFFLFINRNTSVHFDSFGIEYISQEVLNKIEDKSITKNIFRIKCNDCTMCGFYCIAFIEYLIAGKTLLEYANLFSPNNYQKNEKIIYKYFKTLSTLMCFNCCFCFISCCSCRYYKFWSRIKYLSNHFRNKKVLVNYLEKE